MAGPRHLAALHSSSTAQHSTACHTCWCSWVRPRDQTTPIHSHSRLSALASLPLASLMLLWLLPASREAAGGCSLSISPHASYRNGEQGACGEAEKEEAGGGANSANPNATTNEGAHTHTHSTYLHQMWGQLLQTVEQLEQRLPGRRQLTCTGWRCERQQDIESLGVSGNLNATLACASNKTCTPRQHS